MQGSLKTVLYICLKFHKTIEFTVENLSDMQEIYFPESANKQYKEEDFALDDIEDLLGKEDEDRTAALLDFGEKAVDLEFLQFLDLIQFDIENTKKESNCAVKRCDNEVNKWAHISKGNKSHYKEKPIPNYCVALEQATSADTVDSNCNDNDIHCSPWV